MLFLFLPLEASALLAKPSNPLVGLLALDLCDDTFRFVMRNSGRPFFRRSSGIRMSTGNISCEKCICTSPGDGDRMEFAWNDWYLSTVHLLPNSRIMIVRRQRLRLLALHLSAQVAASLDPLPASPPGPGRALPVLVQLRRVCVTMHPPASGGRCRPRTEPGRRSCRRLVRSAQLCAAPGRALSRRSPGPAQLWPPSLGSLLDLLALSPCHPPLVARMTWFKMRFVTSENVCPWHIWK